MHLQIRKTGGNRWMTASAGLVMAILASAVVIAGASPALAEYSSDFGSTGVAMVTADPYSGEKAMIAGYLVSTASDGTTETSRVFKTNGVTATRAFHQNSSHEQTIRAHYYLQRWSTGSNSWVTLEQAVAEKIAPYHGGVTYWVTLDGHWFENVPTLPARTPLRVVYMVEWFDNATSERLGYADMYPQFENNFCPSTPTPQCTVFAEDINW